jgi:hypothetical protein
LSFKRGCPAKVLKARTETQNKTKHPYGIIFPRKRDYFFYTATGSYYEVLISIIATLLLEHSAQRHGMMIAY